MIAQEAWGVKSATADSTQSQFVDTSLSYLKFIYAQHNPAKLAELIDASAYSHPSQSGDDFYGNQDEQEKVDGEDKNVPKGVLPSRVDNSLILEEWNRDYMASNECIVDSHAPPTHSLPKNASAEEAFEITLPPSRIQEVECNVPLPPFSRFDNFMEISADGNSSDKLLSENGYVPSLFGTTAGKQSFIDEIDLSQDEENYECYSDAENESDDEIVCTREFYLPVDRMGNLFTTRRVKTDADTFLWYYLKESEKTEYDEPLDSIKDGREIEEILKEGETIEEEDYDVGDVCSHSYSSNPRIISTLAKMKHGVSSKQPNTDQVTLELQNSMRERYFTDIEIIGDGEALEHE